MTPALGLLVALAPAAPVPERVARETAEYTALRGVWRLAEWGDGAEGHPAGSFFCESEFAGRVMTVRWAGPGRRYYLVTADPAAVPKRMTFVPIHPPAGGPPRPLGPDDPPLRLAYRLDGDRLVTVAARHPGGEFPARVPPTPEPGLDHQVYVRVRDTAPPPRPARRDPR